MVITYYGENCFKIQSGDLVIMTDPVGPKSGLSIPRFKYDILIKTLSDFPPTQKDEEGISICGPGEYNVADANIYGFLLENESSEKMIKTTYKLEVEDINLCFLGHMADIPPPTAMEHLENIDILFIPAGGEPFIPIKKAALLIRQIQPKIVVPAFYKVPGLTRPAKDIKEFIEEFNHSSGETQEKLTIKKKDLSDVKPSQLIILKP